MTGFHYLFSFSSHWIMAMFGILVGSFFSVSRFSSSRYAWLSAVLVIVISLAHESLVEFQPMLEWVLLVLPPVAVVLKYMGDGDILIGIDTLIDIIHVVLYVIAGSAFVMWRFGGEDQ